MQEIVGVKFKKIGKIYFFDADNIKLKKGDGVIVETARGIEYGEVAIENRSIEDEKIVAPLKNVLRIATEEDKKTYLEIAEKTGASTATISRVNRSLNYGTDGYELVFNRMKK